MMINKLIAIELINKYRFGNPSKFLERDSNELEFAKECALVAVDEILYMLDNLLLSPKESIAYKYYLDVKKEIELL